MVEINKIYNENCLDTMKRMEDNLVDLVVTSPPYDDLRQYNGYSFDFENVAKELYRIIKPGGVVVWVVNDATKDGSESGTSFKQALYFKEIGFNINDTMIWCLSGGTQLYVKSHKGVSHMSIKDMVRLNLNEIKLWGGDKWVNIIGVKENVNYEKKCCLQLRSGEKIYCTDEHRWVLKDGTEKLTNELKIGDVLKTCTLPDNGCHNPSFLTKDILWLIGLYLSEGSHSNNTIQISLCADEKSWIERIKNAIEYIGGKVKYTINKNSLNVRIYSKVFDAILSQYLGGRVAKDKHLKPICFNLPNDKLKEIVNGYLDGDGHYDKVNNRWRLGFTKNIYLENDLRTLASRLGAKITLKHKVSKIKSINKEYPSIYGEWRWEFKHHHNCKEKSEILKISYEKRKVGDKMWDIEVDSNEHLFSLGSGVLTHNCKPNAMPQVSQPRYNQCFEYMFVFSKGKPNTFNPIKVPCKCAGQIYDSTVKNMGGESGRTHKTFNINSEKTENNIWEIAVAQNRFDVKHPAVFPEKLATDHILSWSNEGDLVYDPFMGSGTTAVCALKENRNYIGSEISEEYYNFINRRITNAMNNKEDSLW